jgi:hypothetical protein
LNLDVVEEENGNEEEEDDDETHVFPHFQSNHSIQVPSHIQDGSFTNGEANDEQVFFCATLASSEPTDNNVNQFLTESDYNKEEQTEFHFLIEQGFDIDEASDLVYQRRLNTRSKDELSLPIHSQQQQQQQQHHYQQMTSITTTTTTTMQLPEMEGIAAPMKPLIIRYPIRASALTGDLDTDVASLLNRGYTIEQAKEVCQIIYEGREEENRQMQRQRHEFALSALLVRIYSKNIYVVNLLLLINIILLFYFVFSQLKLNYLLYIKLG